MDVALHFYRDLLGFEVRKRMDESGSYLDNMLGLRNAKVTTCKIAAPDGVLVELLQFHSHAPGNRTLPSPCNIGPTHIALTVANLDEVFQKLTSAGVPFNAPPQLSPDGYAKVTFCKDPDGSLIELVEVL